MLLFLISCFSVFLLSKSLPLKPLPPWASGTRLLYTGFWRDLVPILVSSLRTSWTACKTFDISTIMFRKRHRSKVENVEDNGSSLLDLPELALECVLEKLEPTELCKMGEVCKSLRERSTSDYLWERHLKNKWGRLIGPAAYRKWKCHIAQMQDSYQLKKKSIFWSLSSVCSISWVIPKAKKSSLLANSLPADSIMSLYLCLDRGKFWFPAQVYNRENGHVGFMMSCYDAEVCYDSFTDSFQARYPPHGPRQPVVEEYVQWDRIRAPPLDNPPRDLYASGCLDDLRPGDHIEIQWRRNKEFPYGWWYGIVGHLETCDKIESFCRCHKSDTVVLEFNQYTPGSRWRTTTVSRMNHREQGTELEGFYGGIRKLYSKEEISVWLNLWPKETLQ